MFSRARFALQMIAMQNGKQFCRQVALAMNPDAPLSSYDISSPPPPAPTRRAEPPPPPAAAKSDVNKKKKAGPPGYSAPPNGHGPIPAASNRVADPTGPQIRHDPQAQVRELHIHNHFPPVKIIFPVQRDVCGSFWKLKLSIFVMQNIKS